VLIMEFGDTVWSIKATPSGSIVTLMMDVQMPWGVIGKVMDKLFVSSTVAKHQEEMLTNLKKLTEAQ